MRENQAKWNNGHLLDDDNDRGGQMNLHEEETTEAPSPPVGMETPTCTSFFPPLLRATAGEKKKIKWPLGQLCDVSPSKSREMKSYLSRNCQKLYGNTEI